MISDFLYSKSFNKCLYLVPGISFALFLPAFWFLPLACFAELLFSPELYHVLSVSFLFHTPPFFLCTLSLIEFEIERSIEMPFFSYNGLPASLGESFLFFEWVVNALWVVWRGKCLQNVSSQLGGEE